MEVTYRYENDTVHAMLAGSIDNESSQEFRDELRRLLDKSFSEVVFDFSSVTMFSSAAIGKLVMFYKQMVAQGRKMRIQGVNDYIYNLFQFSSLDLLFPIER